MAGHDYNEVIKLKEFQHLECVKQKLSRLPSGLHIDDVASMNGGAVAVMGTNGGAVDDIGMNGGAMTDVSTEGGAEVDIDMLICQVCV